MLEERDWLLSIKVIIEFVLLNPLFQSLFSPKGPMSLNCINDVRVTQFNKRMTCHFRTAVLTPRNKTKGEYTRKILYPKNMPSDVLLSTEESLNMPTCSKKSNIFQNCNSMLRQISETEVKWERGRDVLISKIFCTQCFFVNNCLLSANNWSETLIIETLKNHYICDNGVPLRMNRKLFVAKQA